MSRSITRKKVLIISYYWPPCGGIGVLRCLKIAKYLRQYGWEPIVFTAENAHYPSIDHSNEKDIPKDLMILRQKIWEPYHIYKFITGQKKDANVNNVFYVKDKKLGKAHQFSVWLRSNFFIPDARAWWIRPSVRYLLKYLKENPVDAIFSDGPPHSNTRIATILKQKIGIPWLADFQDPWTQIDYYQLLSLTKWGDAKHRRLEQEAFKAADKSTIVSPTWKRDLEAIGAKNVSVVPWGYDPDDYKNLRSNIGQKFTFTHLGIMGYDRTPKVFFEVLDKLCNEIEGFKEHLELQLVGQVDHSIQSFLKTKENFTGVKIVGNVNRVKALEMTLNSPILLLLLNQQTNAQGRIPGKLFEYLAAKRPIFCLEPMPSDVSEIIAETRSGHTCNYDDARQIEKTIRTLYQQFLEGSLQSPVNSDIEDYSIVKLTGQIAGYLDAISA